MLYRYFQAREHALALAEGRVYVSTLGACRGYERAGQGDSGEAKHSFEVARLSSDSMSIQEIHEEAKRVGIWIDPSPGIQNVRIENCSRTTGLSDAFVICTTASQASRALEETFGPHCVEIRNPGAFHAAVTEALCSRFRVREALWGPVVYRDRTWRQGERDDIPLGFAKPRDQFADQQEVRFLWTVDQPAAIEPFELYVPKVRDFCVLRGA